MSKAGAERGVDTSQVKSWNTVNLGQRVGADVASAATASVLVAPLICVIDRSIVTKASTGKPFSTIFLEAARPALTRPHTFLISQPFLLIFGLYFGTYLTANTIDTITATVESKPASKVTSGPTKFIATSSFNLTACVYKDSIFVKLFGKKAAAGNSIPKLSYLLFAARDSLTIFASFNLPSLIAPQLANLPPAVKQRFSRILSTESGRSNTAQFIAPAAMQIVSTPLHLLGLDLFNRQNNVGAGARLTRVVRDWGVSSLARMGRIVPAFGFGGVVNSSMRRSMMKKLEV